MLLPSQLLKSTESKIPEFKSSLIVNDDFGLPFTLFFPLVYYTAVLDTTIIVPVGFATDLASIPVGLWNILPKSGRYDRAAVIHDYLYQFNGCTRKDADDILDEAMGVLKVGGVRKFMIYHGVRIGGWNTWAKYRNVKSAIKEADRVETAIEVKKEEHEK